MTLAGVWQNEYGSIMRLEEAADGLISGGYASSTGATGTYPVIGWALGEPKNSTEGRPVALTIAWRSLDPGGEDDSWHWVSGLTGQRVIDPAAGPTLVLNHALNATTPLAGFVEIGTYVDKLIYRAASAAKGAALPARDWRADPRDAFAGGTWQSDAPALRLTLDPGVTPQGAVSGHIRSDTLDVDCAGFVDSHPETTTTRVRAIALATRDAKRGTIEALVGRIDLASGRMTLDRMIGRRTPVKATYLQTAIDRLVLVPA